MNLLTSGAGLLLLAATSSLLTGEQPDLSHYLLTKAQRLFSLKYGSGDSQVGILIAGPEEGPSSGPSDFAVGVQGSIYIADRHNGKVKRFESDGRLLAMTDGRVDRISAVTADSSGRTFVVHRVRSVDKVKVYDEKGKEVPEDASKVNALLERVFSEHPELNRSAGGQVTLVGVSSDARDNLYFRCPRYVVKVNRGLTKAEFLSDSWPLDAKGSTYSYRYLSAEQQTEHLVYGVDRALASRYVLGILRRAEISIHGPDRSLTRRFLLPRGDWNEVERRAPSGADHIRCDERGHFYALRSPLTIHNIALIPDCRSFGVTLFYAIFEYDGEGRYVGLRAIINSFTAPSINWVEVDSRGNVYWLDYQADGLNVMMAPLPETEKRRPKG